MQALCRVEDIPQGSGREIEAESSQGTLRLVVFNIQEQITAYMNTCPHQGRSLAFAANEFLLDKGKQLVCPHHGACFDISDGLCVAGPCKGDSLTAVAIAIRGGVIYLEQ